MKKKALSLALALVMCLGLTVPAFADEYRPLEIRFEQSSSEVVVLVIDQATLSGDTIMVKPESTFSVKVENMVGSWSNASVGLFGEFQSKHGGWSVIPNLYDGVNERSASAENAAELFSRADRYIGYYDSEQVGALVRFVVKSRDCETKYYLFLDDSAQTKPDDSKPTDPEFTTPSAAPTNDKLEVDGTPADPTVYKIDGSNYFKIRDVAALLNGTEKQFAVGYDGALNSVTATTGQGYDKQPGDLAGAATGGDQEAAVSNDTIYVDGQKVEAEVYKINGSNYFKLRDLGKALNFYVGWTAERGMYLETDKPYAE